MRKRLLGFLGAALIASAVIAGCTDRAPSAPNAPLSATASQPSNSLLGGLVGGVVGVLGKLVNIVVSLVARPAPLPQDIVWSFNAGPGGVISANRAAGLSVAIPPGALSQNVRITVRVKAGNVYNYQFAPEGLQFAKPVLVTQDVVFPGPYGTLFTVYRAVSTVELDSVSVNSDANARMSPVSQSSVSSGLVAVGNGGLVQCHHS